MGIRTVITLRGEEKYSHYLFEKESCETLGLTLEHAKLWARTAAPRKRIVGVIDALRAAELLNGSNRPGEQERAEKLLSRLRLAGTGGSDAHLVSAIGKCMTRFATTVSSEAELVAGLRQGGFHAVQLDETLQAQP